MKTIFYDNQNSHSISALNWVYQESQNMRPPSWALYIYIRLYLLDEHGGENGLTQIETLACRTFFRPIRILEHFLKNIKI